MKKYGFSLGEMLVTIGIVAFLAAVLLPVLKNVLPNEELMLFKKSYYITERAIAELVNDDDLYPEADAEDNPYLGNTTTVEYNGKNYQGDTKFCELFAMKLNRMSEIDCTEKTFTDGVVPDGTLTTNDKVVWLLPITAFDSETVAQDIQMDVNGDKAPNCFYDAETCKKPDRFTVHVYQDGRVMVDGIMEREYLYRKDITNDAKNETEEAKAEEEK